MATKYKKNPDGHLEVTKTESESEKSVYSVRQLQEMKQSYLIDIESYTGKIAESQNAVDEIDVLLAKAAELETI